MCPWTSGQVAPRGQPAAEVRRVEEGSAEGREIGRGRPTSVSQPGWTVWPFQMTGAREEKRMS